LMTLLPMKFLLISGLKVVSKIMIARGMK